ncbi:hypothetical protein NQ314_015689 [Rhamnusium bicolor]|uniref:CHK kinase-like domain-containing protein n=1 Tax=Rhamnusium bicolor TaxID=1586634 RepID=A0AAV8WYP7_9CUCU|nr:hypothetical protein NQ314_015689 [Rhamnusium bicolor]
MNVKLSEEHNKLIEDIALRQGLSNFDLETNSGSIKGDGYLGIITTADIKNGKNKLNLILKSAQDNEELRKMAPVRDIYLREIYLYNKIFPEFDKFQRENGLLNGFSGHAKIYGSCDKQNEECLVLENLREIGYKLWNRKVPMNSEHVGLVFAEYGKFHAISLAMNTKEPEMYKKLSENLGNVFKNSAANGLLQKMQQFVLENGFKAVKGNNLATHALEKFSVNLEGFLNDDLEVFEDQLVITHGDCWCNNMMFKYENTQDIATPTKVCFLDWQLARTGSPVLDLLLEYHWKKYSKFGLFMSLMVIKIMLSEADEVPDLGATAESGRDFVDEISYDFVNVNDYNQRIVDIVTFMAEHKLI